jgi:cellulose synthase/poly-beta-1,6-N-acetylglucosamine synthase-like glycosyltransferase
LVAGVLLTFTARRWLFIFGALVPDRPKPESAHSPDPAPVLLLAPIRNEAQALPEFLTALAGLDYPAEKLTVVLVNDGSTDESEALIQDWIEGRANWRLLSLPGNVGKAQALNLALKQFSQGDIVAVYDADERPRSDALLTLVGPFADPHVGGVSGRRAIRNALASPAASYTTFEGLVHQLVTLRAKDKLNLAPAILGANCAYRRAALAQVGNFKPGALLEDSDLTLKLARAGWKIRFEPQSVSYHTTPESVSGYWRQHTRWARGFNEVAKAQAQITLFDQQLPLFLRLELLAFALGYLDRLALLVGAGLSLMSRRARPLLGWVVGVALLTPLVQIMAALTVGREPLAMWLRIVWLPVFLMLDMAMAAAGLWATLRQAPQIWEERRARS